MDQASLFQYATTKIRFNLTPLLVCHIDLEICRVCDGSMRVIACIENLLVIEKVLIQQRGKALCLGSRFAEKGATAG